VGKPAKRWFVKYHELMAYGAVGLGVTVLNIALFWLFETAFGLHYLTANALAWALAFIAAFCGNKYIVFRGSIGSTKCFLYEPLTFLGARLISGALDMVIMFVGVHLLSMDELLVKVVDNIFVIIFNYAAAKLVIFKKAKGDA
jgi:putative flippase GtrA